MEDVVVDEQVVPQIGELVLHVTEQPPNVGCEVYHMRRPVLVKDRFGLLHVPEGGDVVEEVDEQLLLAKERVVDIASRSHAPLTASQRRHTHTHTHTNKAPTSSHHPCWTGTPTARLPFACHTGSRRARS